MTKPARSEYTKPGLSHQVKKQFGVDGRNRFRENLARQAKALMTENFRGRKKITTSEIEDFLTSGLGTTKDYVCSCISHCVPDEFTKEMPCKSTTKH
jgi:hypothetical protein